MAKKRKRREKQVVGFIGVGLDNDGHQRLTRSEHFILVGGSDQTHSHMQDTAIRFTEGLQRRGKELVETPIEEVIEILHESHE